MSDKKISRNKTSDFPIKRIVLSSLSGAGFYFIFLVLFAVAVLKIGLGNGMFMPFGLINAALTSFLSGFAALFKIKEKAFQYGSLTGLFQALICMTVLFILNGANGGNGLFIQFGIMVAFALIGAVVSANLKVKNRFKV